jgi:hypothetical protein
VQPIVVPYSTASGTYDGIIQGTEKRCEKFKGPL